jgi:uncharacterized protein (TIGR03118 family)
VKRKFSWLCCLLLAGSGLIAESATAQTKAYRQTNLASSVPGAAANEAQSLNQPWGIAFLPGQPFFIAASGSGSVSAVNSSGLPAGDVAIPPSSGNMGGAIPLGIASDGSGVFGTPSSPAQYVVVTQTGTIAGFSAPNGSVPAQATILRNDSASGAVYTALALLHPGCCAPFVAVADFNDGTIHTFTNTFDLLDRPGAFQDPKMPAGYAPYGMQVIGNQLFITYALQDAAKRSPVIGAGNGVVDVFDTQGNFVRRFATGGNLNAPWGVALASANFGPFSGAILIGNSGDGTISAFDAASGDFLGQISDGDGGVIANPGIRSLTFRADGVTDANTLFFTADTQNGQGGLFGAISSGLVSTTRVSVSTAAANKSATLTATVNAGPGNSGMPSGTVTISSGGVPQGTAPLVDGVATITIAPAAKGMHVIDAQFSGDATFLPSSSKTEMQGAAAAAVTADFSLAVSPSSVSVTSGQSSSPLMATVTPSGGFTGNVSLSCSSAVPGISCTFGSATLAITSGMASTTMTVNTAMNVPRYGLLPPGSIPLGGILAVFALLSLTIWSAGRLQRARVPVLTTAAVLAIFALSLTLVGCGYGSSYMPPQQNPGPAVLTVTAQSGALTHTQTVNVTVH